MPVGKDVGSLTQRMHTELGITENINSRLRAKLNKVRGGAQAASSGVPGAISSNEPPMTELMGYIEQEHSMTQKLLDELDEFI